MCISILSRDCMRALTRWFHQWGRATTDLLPPQNPTWKPSAVFLHLLRFWTMKLCEVWVQRWGWNANLLKLLLLKTTVYYRTVCCTFPLLFFCGQCARPDIKRGNAEESVWASLVYNQVGRQVCCLNRAHLMAEANFKIARKLQKSVNLAGLKEHRAASAGVAQ